MDKIAKATKLLVYNVGDYGYVQRILYTASPSIEGYEHVVSSAIQTEDVHEVMIFASDTKGNIKDYSGIEFAMNTTNPGIAFAKLGYQVDMSSITK